MSWHILLADCDGQKFTSLPLRDRTEAIAVARQLVSEGDLQVLKIAPDNGEEVDIDALGLKSTLSVRAVSAA